MNHEVTPVKKTHKNPGSPQRSERTVWGIDLHVHTAFSPDSNMDPRHACIAAAARGLEIIGFADHAEFVATDDAYVGKVDQDRILEMIAGLRREYKGKLEILYGVEIGFIPGREAEIAVYLDSHPFDYAIGSVHYVDGKLESAWTRGREQTGQDFTPYFQTVLAAAKSGLFQVLGHVEYVRKYMYDPGKYEGTAYVDIVEDILQAAVHNDLTLELNTSGWRHATGEPYPGRGVLTRFRELGGKITVGSDAHKYYEVGYGDGKARGLLKDVGYAGVQVFRKRQRFNLPL